MSAWACSSAAVRGFTMVEMIVVLILVGVLSASAVPLMSNATGMRDQAWHDAALSALRFARATAVSHRRVVCATFTNSSVSLTIALLRTSPSCAGTLLGPEGSAVFDSSRNASATTTLSYSDRDAGTSSSLGQAATLYFQPDGRVTSSFSGAMTTRNWAWTIVPSSAEAITLEGAAGYAY